jgi:hypothetical protein
MPIAAGTDPLGLTPRGLGDGAEAREPTDGLAVGGAAGFGVLMAKVDEAMIHKAERAIVQRGADSAQDLVRLLLAPCSGPDVDYDQVLAAFLRAHRPVALAGLAEGDVGSGEPYGTSEKMGSAEKRAVSAASVVSAAKMDCWSDHTADVVMTAEASLACRH